MGIRRYLTVILIFKYSIQRWQLVSYEELDKVNTPWMCCMQVYSCIHTYIHTHLFLSLLRNSHSNYQPLAISKKWKAYDLQTSDTLLTPIPVIKVTSVPSKVLICVWRKKKGSLLTFRYVGMCWENTVFSQLELLIHYFIETMRSCNLVTLFSKFLTYWMLTDVTSIEFPGIWI